MAIGQPVQNMENAQLQRPKKWPQYLAACLAALVAMCNGSLEGWTSPALPYLQSHQLHDGNFTNVTLTENVDDDEASWIGSLAPLGALFGALPSGYLADKFGRRLMLLVLVIPLVLGWIAIILAKKMVTLLYTARFILGLTMGATTVIIPLYNEEIAETSLRGELGTYMDLSITIGILYAYSLGAFIPYIWLCIACGIIPVIFGVTFFWMPESPVYLLSKGRKDEAVKSLCWLRNAKNLDSPLVREEINALQCAIANSSVLQTENGKCLKTNMKIFKENLSLTPNLAKILMIVFGLMIFQQLSGINAVIFYTVDIFEAAGSIISPYYCTLIVGIVQVVATFIASLFMDHVGRRVLLLVSDICMAVCHLALAVYFYFGDQGTDLSSWNWLPLVAFNIFIVVYSVGFGPIPWFMMVELSPNEAKGLVSALAVSLNWSLVFVVTKVFTVMMGGLGPTGTYGILCVICVVGSIFVALLVPETRGKTREEIQEGLQRTKI